VGEEGGGSEGSALARKEGERGCHEEGGTEKNGNEEKILRIYGSATTMAAKNGEVGN